MSMGNETSSTGFGGEASGTPEAVADAGQDVKQDTKRLGSEVAALASAKVGQVRDAAQEYYQTGKERAQQLVDTGKDKAQQYLDAGREKAQQAYDSGAARAQEYYQTGKDKAQEYLDTGREKAHEYYDLSKAKAQEWESDVEQFIREKPLQSVLIAAGVGAILGLLMRR